MQKHQNFVYCNFNSLIKLNSLTTHFCVVLIKINMNMVMINRTHETKLRQGWLLTLIVPTLVLQTTMCLTQISNNNRRRRYHIHNKVMHLHTHHFPFGCLKWLLLLYMEEVVPQQPRPLDTHILAIQVCKLLFQNFFIQFYRCVYVWFWGDKIDLDWIVFFKLILVQSE